MISNSSCCVLPLLQVGETHRLHQKMYNSYSVAPQQILLTDNHPFSFAVPHKWLQLPRSLTLSSTLISFPFFFHFNNNRNLTGMCWVLEGGGEAEGEGEEEGEERGRILKIQPFGPHHTTFGSLHRLKDLSLHRTWDRSGHIHSSWHHNTTHSEVLQ